MGRKQFQDNTELQNRINSKHRKWGQGPQETNLSRFSGQEDLYPWPYQYAKEGETERQRIYQHKKVGAEKAHNANT